MSENSSEKACASHGVSAAAVLCPYGLTEVGADGRAIDGGRSAAALLKRPQHNLTLAR